jgi:S-formylglutathione hydrolase FrmB
MPRLLLCLLPLLLLGAAPPRPDAGVALADARDRSLGAHLEYVQVESEALRGNLIGDPAVREMAVLLPPSYFDEPTRRYPTVYLLHGLGKRRDGHLDLTYVQRELFRTMKAQQLSEMIVVAVDGTTSFGGSYYANSPTIGNFERYVVREVVGKVDGQFRTLPSAGARGLAGFSMGGHGAMKLVMRYGGVFSVVGSLSGSPMSIRYRKSIYKTALGRHKRPRTVQELKQLLPFERDWSTAAAYAKAAAFSPNARKPPLFLDLPFESKVEDLDDDPVWQKWWEDDPLALVPRYQKQLRAMNLIYLDHGDNETALGTEDFDRELVRYNIGHVHYIFRGDHTDKMVSRYLRMLRHFSVAWSY